MLLLVSVTTCETRYLSTHWRSPLYVAIYPIAADASPVTRAYVEALDAERFKPIDAFFAREAKRYGVELDDPVKTRLRPQLQRPPTAARTGRLHPDDHALEPPAAILGVARERTRRGARGHPHVRPVPRSGADSGGTALARLAERTHRRCVRIRDTRHGRHQRHGHRARTSAYARRHG